GLLPGPEQLTEVAVETVAQRGPGHPGGREVLLRGGVNSERRIGGVEPGAVRARVEDPPRPGLDRRIDRSTVLRDDIGADVARGDEQHLLCAGEGVTQRIGVVIAPLTYADPLVGQVLGATRVSHADPDGARRHAVQEVLDGGAVELARRSGHDDHERVLSSRCRTADAGGDKLTGAVNLLSARMMPELDQAGQLLLLITKGASETCPVRRPSARTHAGTPSGSAPPRWTCSASVASRCRSRRS